MLFALVVMVGVLLLTMAFNNRSGPHLGIALARDGTAAPVELGQRGDSVVTRVGIPAVTAAAMAVVTAVMGAVAGEISESER